ncbi:pyridoxamine 5'-phosphate oxidase family protein [Natronolimnohabitans sp. A-GB9]|uniref:pyridoxamine 5'-phosphate oxidase family protein n=1 Tax=Natronolimnohabitans sp. A-GB9 TaxID=3069757 RepID=UPI0027ADCA2D|nr:pyridoxamine 5'-phosphate oxidase family protein [Natronolimnohabitans sp. A-GB9]MDQ2051466.1 pyridoxamine 5'-phosphate oxidase family protein [Natronolimnohabitans sp. A-GB9]
MHVRGSRSRSEIEAFLDETTVPVRLGCRTPAGNPWMVSLWYRRRVPDDAADDRPWILECATASSADLVSFLRADPAVSFEVSTNRPPYRGVRGRGSVTIEPDPEKETLRSLLERYLGGTDSELAETLLAEERDEVTITIEPDVVYGWDYSDRMQESE